MDTNYIKDRVDDILRQKIAMGGLYHRYSDRECGNQNAKGRYWLQERKGKKKCMPYSEHAARLSRKYNGGECGCCGGVLVGGGSKRRYHRRGGAGTRMGARHNPWIEFLKEFRMMNPQYDHMRQSELVKIAREYYPNR